MVILNVKQTRSLLSSQQICMYRKSLSRIHTSLTWIIKAESQGPSVKFQSSVNLIDLTHSQWKEEWKHFKMCLVDFQKNYFESPPQISPKGIYDFYQDDFISKCELMRVLKSSSKFRLISIDPKIWLWVYSQSATLSNNLQSSCNQQNCSLNASIMNSVGSQTHLVVFPQFRKT